MGCIRLLWLVLLAGCTPAQTTTDNGCHTDDCHIHLRFAPPDPQQVEKDVDAIRAGMQMQHGQQQLAPTVVP